MHHYMDVITDELLSIVVPLYNEEENVALLTEKIHKSLKGYQYQIVYVDDFSTDRTRQVVRELKDPKIHMIALKKNYGQSLALAAGIDYASGQYIITMDGDLQNDPSDIPNMLPYALSGEYDVVTGIRQKRRDSLVKKIPSKIANFLVRRVTKLDIKDNGCALKVFTKTIAKDLNLYGEMHRFITLLAHLEGAQIKQLPVKHHARHAGVSNPFVMRHHARFETMFKAFRDVQAGEEVKGKFHFQGDCRHDAPVVHPQVFPKAHPLIRDLRGFTDYFGSAHQCVSADCQTGL